MVLRAKTGARAASSSEPRGAAAQRPALAEYRSKRDFGKTPEPRGHPRARRSAARAFVVHKHMASHLHYDFRLEHEGVMLSWSVPKGPSLDPSIKRLAIQTEDHPIEYNDFEGVIPEGEYGSGTVMIWDRGTWEPADPDEDVSEALERGRLSFVLHGKKLAGGFTLVRIGERKWLLTKRRDAYADALHDPTVEDPRSVATGRTMVEIARAGGASREQIARAALADGKALLHPG